MAAAKTYPLSLILTAVDRVSSVMRKIDKNVGNVGKSMSKVGKKMTVGVTLPIAGVAATATKAFADFEHQMAAVDTLIDSNTENIKDMGDEVLRIARETPVELEDLTGGLYSLRSAGIGAEGQFEHLTNAAKLATAGLGTTDQAVDVATSAINSFGLQGEDAEKIYGMLFTAIKFGKTDLAGMAQGFGGVAKQIAATGTPVDQFIAAVSAMTTTGQPASQAYSQLRAVMTGLTRDTKETRHVFRALGAKDLPDLIKKSGGLVPALDEVNRVLGGNQQKILKLVGSSEAFNAVMALTGELGEANAQALAAMNGGMGLLEQGFQKRNATMTAQWKRTKNTLISAGMVIGEAVAPIFLQLAEGIRDVANWFGSLDKSTQRWIIAAGAAVAAIGPLVFVVGKAITFAGLLAKGIGFVATAIRILGVALATNPIGAVISLIAAGALLIIDNWETVGPFFEATWEWIKKVFKAGWEFIEPYVGWVVDAGKKVAEVGEKVANFIVDDDIGTIPIGQARRQMGLAPPKPPLRNQSSINVQFQSTPAGTRIEVDPQSDDDVEVGVGYQMGAQ